MSDVSNKRFVHFDGTKQEFIDGGYDKIYPESVVFINGDGDENNNIIYTHGEYYAEKTQIYSTIENMKKSIDSSIRELKNSIGLATLGEINAIFDSYLYSNASSS